VADNRWHIEGSFRDGSYRVRDPDGKYKSLSVAILEETPEVNSFTVDSLAKKFEIDRQIILEHLGHLKEEGLIERVTGGWAKLNDFDSGENYRREMTEEQEWANKDHDSVY
jgi:predicted transcriptional regulator of viral defense system